MTSNETLTAAQEYAESIVDTVREPLIVLDHELRVISASRSFYEVFKVKPEETTGRLIYDLGNKQWDIPKLRELLETILPEQATFDDYEVEHDFATIGKRTMLLPSKTSPGARDATTLITGWRQSLTRRSMALSGKICAAIL
jgi:PAS domain-containing protein